MGPEKRYTPTLAGRGVHLENRVGSDPPTIVGFGAVFYRANDPGTEYCLWDFDDERCMERLMPGCFDRVMAQPGFDCLSLFNHNYDIILGRLSSGTMTLGCDSMGLRFTVVPGDAPLNLGVVASVQRRDVTGSSFSFTVDDDGERWREQGSLVIREIHSVSGLFDVGPVASPAYKATTAGLRGQDAGAARERYTAWKPSENGRINWAMARARVVQLGL